MIEQKWTDHAFSRVFWITCTECDRYWNSEVNRFAAERSHRDIYTENEEWLMKYVSRYCTHVKELA